MSDITEINHGTAAKEDIARILLNKYKLNDAFYMADVDKIVGKVDKWYALLPRVHPFYAVKCNPDIGLLKLLGNRGVNFDCASEGEMKLVIEELGFEPSRIINAQPNKQPSQLSYACTHGVNLATFDSIYELAKIKSHHPHLKLLIRIVVEDCSDVCSFSSKFGVFESEVIPILEEAKQLSLDVVGVSCVGSFHAGSPCCDASLYTKAIIQSASVFNIAKQLGFHFTILDIGGGFLDEAEHWGRELSSFEEIADAVNSSLDQYFPVDEGVRIISEPGQYFTYSAFTLVTHVIGKRKRKMKNGISIETPHRPTDVDTSYCLEYFINDGMFGSFAAFGLYTHVERPRIAILQNPHKQLPDVPQNRSRYVSTIWGPCCDSLDVVIKECILPEMNIGENLIFHDTGSYYVACASGFNGLPIPKAYCYKCY